ncbi:MAG TPA: amidohydrolase family protein [Amycolatopsis sp.]|uniref:amidohydrolase family protein n=1 Tax=Amycolatopsis sp. TaxID=37632 RepID=UPI002B49D04A|nr:amidohydrolase family protein [Amycolatopsis sp.]HKS46987.1 amidohydrolase family protein [Amycolatopsis sp.]
MSVRNVNHRQAQQTESDAEREARRQAEIARRAEYERHRSYRLVDADQHYYEPDDCFTRHLESKYADEAIVVRRDQADGLGRLYRAGKRLRHISGPLGERTSPPGALREYFKSHGEVRPDAGGVRAQDHPEYMNDRNARLKVLDEHDLEAILLLPTLGVLVESECCAYKDIDPKVWYALMRSFNRWVEDDWGYGADGRIFASPLVSLYDPELAVVEVERLIAAGAKSAILRAGPAFGRSPADPVFDPFWARAQEANLVIAFHLGDFGYQDTFAREWGYGRSHYPAALASGFEAITCAGDRAMSDTIVALIFGDLFGRFPNLKCMIIELGSVWLPPLLEKMDMIWGRGVRDKVKISEPPSEVYKQHFWISPYYEDPWREIIECVGVDRVVYGSDWPHPEGLPEPLDVLEEIGIVTPDELKLIVRDNTASLLGI